MKSYNFKVVKAGKAVAETTTLTEARKEAKRVGGVAMAGTGYSKQRNPRKYKLNQKAYKHYVLDTRTNRIASGWEYPEDAKEAIKELAIDFPAAKKSLKVVSKAALVKLGVSPDDNVHWAEIVELQGAIKRNPSSGAKQRARGTRLKGQYPRNFDQSELGMSEAKAARKEIAGYLQREKVPLQEAWGTFSGPRVREAIPREKQRHAQGLKRAAQHRPQLPNPSQQEHAKRGQDRLKLAQDAYRVALHGKDAAANLEMAITWAGMAQSDLQDASDWDRAALASQLLNEALMMVPKVIRKR